MFGVHSQPDYSYIFEFNFSRYHIGQLRCKGLKWGMGIQCELLGSDNWLRCTSWVTTNSEHGIVAASCVKPLRVKSVCKTHSAKSEYKRQEGGTAARFAIVCLQSYSTISLQQQQWWWKSGAISSQIVTQFSWTLLVFYGDNVKKQHRENAVSFSLFLMF